MARYVEKMREAAGEGDWSRLLDLANRDDAGPVDREYAFSHLKTHGDVRISLKLPEPSPFTIEAGSELMVGGLRCVVFADVGDSVYVATTDQSHDLAQHVVLSLEKGVIEYEGRPPTSTAYLGIPPRSIWYHYSSRRVVGYVGRGTPQGGDIGVELYWFDTDRHSTRSVFTFMRDFWPIGPPHPRLPPIILRPPCRSCGGDNPSDCDACDGWGYDLDQIVHQDIELALRRYAESKG